MQRCRRTAPHGGNTSYRLYSPARTSGLKTRKPKQPAVLLQDDPTCKFNLAHWVWDRCFERTNKLGRQRVSQLGQLRSLALSRILLWRRVDSRDIVGSSSRHGSTPACAASTPTSSPKLLQTETQGTGSHPAPRPRRSEARNGAVSAAEARIPGGPRALPGPV